MDDTLTGARATIQARALVNAGGPWVEEVLGRGAGVNARAKVRLVQGSHIVVRKLYDHDRAYIFQNADGRIVFVIPYQGDFTLIGTTDRDYDGDPAKVKATRRGDRLSLRGGQRISRQAGARRPTWSGPIPACVRSMTTAPAKPRPRRATTCWSSTRPAARRCCRSIGGKITTYRRLAEEALERLAPYLPQREGARRLDRQTRRCPAATWPFRRSTALIAELARGYPFLAPRPCRPPRARLRHAGEQAARRGANRRADLGQAFGATLTEAEVALSHGATNGPSRAEDVVWRRSKLGLRLSADEIAALDDWMGTARRAGEAPASKREGAR